MLKFLLSIVLVVFFLSPYVHAEEVMTTDGDEYDFSWLDPDKKIYVVQNRKYTKKQKLEVALSGGVGIGQPYRSTKTLLARGFYYFNESWGASFFAGFNSNAENDNFSALKSVSSVVPAVRDVQNFFGGSVVWVPFYGKLNMFNQILYIDWHIEAGLSQVSSEIDLNTSNTGNPSISETSHTGFHWGTGQKFFITRHLAARLDYLAIFYKAPNGLKGSLTGNGSTDETYDNHFLTLGLSYTF